MRRKAITNGLANVRAVQANQRSSGSVGADRVNDDQVFSLGDAIQERHAERAAVEHEDVVSEVVLPLEPRESGGAEPVIGQKHIAEPEHQQSRLTGNLPLRGAQLRFARLIERNLYPENIESNMPTCSTVEDKKTK